MKRLGKRGFTLIEVVATIAVSALVMAALLTFTQVTGKIFLESAWESESRLILSSVEEALKKELAYAEEISLADPGGSHYLEFRDGRLYKDGILLLSEGFYGSTQLQGTVEGSGGLLTFILKTQSQGRFREEAVVLRTLKTSDSVISPPVTALYYR